MNLTAIKAIFRKDLLDGARNYHVILMVLTPIILSFLFANVMSGNKSMALPDIGIISSPQQPLIKALAGKGLDKLTFFQDRHELESAILEGKVKFGIILPEIIALSPNRPQNRAITLLYPPHIPDFGVETLKSAFETEIRNQLKLAPPPLPFEFKTEPVAGRGKSGGSVADSMFPMLIVMAMGMVGFLALPMSIVEEREKGTLNAIFLTPLRIHEFILGKTLFSLFLAILTICTMLTINGKWGNNPAWLVAFIMSGTLMTIFTGLLIANFAQTQGSVNAIGTTLFLFFQMIPSLQHTSDVVAKVAPFCPSTYIFSGLRKAMFLDLNKVTIFDDLIKVSLITALAYLITFTFYKIKKADK